MIQPGAKTGTIGQLSGTPGKQTIVIAAPKSGNVSAGTPTKIITTVPKLATSSAGGTQFIVVATRPGGTTHSKYMI